MLANGQSYTKKEWLGILRGPDRPTLQVLDPENIQVHVFGNVAILTDHTTIKGHDSKGNSMDGEFNVFRVVIKKNGSLAGDRRGDESGPVEKISFLGIFPAPNQRNDSAWRFKPGWDRFRRITMKRAYGLAVTILLVVASGAVALGQAPKKPAAAGEDVAGTVAILDHVWLDAAHNHDGETAAWLFADNFVEIHPGGFLVTKQQQVDMISEYPTRRPRHPVQRHSGALRIARCCRANGHNHDSRQAG